MFFIAVTPIFFLLAATLGSWPVTFWKLLRLVVFACALAVGADIFRSRRPAPLNPPVAGVFLVVAILFNPLFTIHFSRGVWHWLDYIAAVPFAVYLYFNRRH